VRHARSIVALLVGASAARAEPPRTLAMPDLSLSRVAGVDLLVGGFDRQYSALVAARLDLFVDLALGSAAKVSARIALGYEHHVIDEGEDVDGPWLGNLMLGGRWLPVRAAEGGGVETAFGATLLLPTGTAGDEGDPGVVTGFYHRAHTPRHIDPTYMTVQLEADIRYRRDDAFGQLSAAVLNVFDDGPQVDILRFGLGGGSRIARQLSLVGELTVLAVPPDGHTEIGLDVGLEWRVARTSFTGHYYLPLVRHIDGSYGALGAGVTAAF
jgi:hypothetical protein